MDKKSNRSDLLNAGRKKLQQYRQKKDTKGKDGKGKDGKSTSKSSSRADKSVQNDADSNLVSDIDATKAQSSRLSGKEAETSAKSVDISIDSQKDVENSDGTSVDTQSSVGLPSLDVVSTETSLTCESDSNTLTVGSEVKIGAEEFEGSGTLGSTEVNAVNVDILSPSDPATEAASDAIVAANSVESMGLLEGDQVSVVGAMQEADSYDPKHPDSKVELELGTDETSPVSGVISENLIITTPDTELGVSAATTSGTIEDHETAEASDPVKTTPVAAETGSSQKLARQGEDLMNWSSKDNSSDFQSVSNTGYSESEESLDQKVVKEYEETDLPEAACVNDVKNHEDDAEGTSNDTRDRSLCPGVQDYSLNVVQLAEVPKELLIDDFKSTELTDHGDSPVLCSGVVALPLILQEQFYLANISKDFFHLLLLDQHKQQTDHTPAEVPALSALLTDVQECNGRLSAELAQCRSELEVAVKEKLNFQNMYNNAKKENMELSAQIDEFKIQSDESVTYISSVSADLAKCKVSLETAEVENEKLLKSLASVSEQRNKFEELMQQYSHENQKLSLNMADSSSQLAALEQETTSLKSSLASMIDERKKIEEESKFLIHENQMLSGDLADCRSVIVSLNQENSSLNASLAVLSEETKNLKDHEDFLSQEFERLSTELVVYRDKVSVQYQAHVQLEAELKKTLSSLEQIAEENIVLRSSLEIYKAGIDETDSRQIQLSSVGTDSRAHIQTADIDSSVENSVKEVTEAALLVDDSSAEVVTDGMSPSELQSGFGEGALTLKGYLGEAGKIVQKLGKAVDGMHSHSENLSRSSGKNAAPGISKLIQAFESKTNVDDRESEESPLTESVGPLDPYLMAKEQLSSLGYVLQTISQSADHVDALIKKENSRCKAAVIACDELEVESLKSISDSLEARNIELEVICGVLNQHAHNTEAMKSQLEVLCEALKQQCAGLHLQNSELLKKLTDSHSRISDLQIQLKEIREGSVMVSSTILNEVETFRRDMREDILSVEREWNSAFTKLVPMVQKLETAVRSAVTSPPLCEASHDLDVFGRFSLSVSAACEVIENWKPRLHAHDELSCSYRQVEEKLCGVNEERNLAICLLQKFSTDLVNLLNSVDAHFENSIHMKENNQLDPLDAKYYDALVAKLGTILGDILQLKEINSKLSSDLSNKEHGIEELKKQCLDADTVLKLVMDVKEILKVHDTEVNLDESPITHLQSSFSLLIQKYKELEEQVSVSNNNLNARVIEFDELQGYVELSNSLIIQQQTDFLVLRASLVRAKDAFDAMQVELLQKIKDLGLSEQRVASVREKLSIAVTKGKGLVVQRDSLKQSLAEMSSELERCSQELQLKDSRILEVEEKLKDYSEAGERMEALESELTYIRNSATALRESFFLKDSSLQRIEEILEELELPDHFHSKDIIEKVDWLAKTISGNSLPPTDWDQRSSVGGGSYSDAGFVITDGFKDDVQPSSNMDDDLRKKYEELQTKYYEVAEHNEMLEQSLMERNILVQRWEEILDRINTPNQIRSMEPEERIHWLGTALSEADHHMRSLQQKIENLESYCGSLSNDLEESQRRTYELELSLEAILREKDNALQEADVYSKSLQQKIDNFESYCGSLSSDLKDSQRRISELDSSLQAVIQDREILSRSLVTSTTDCEIAMGTASQCELEQDRLKKEVDILQASLAKKLDSEEQLYQIESDLKRLQSLILDVLQDTEIKDELSASSNIQILERLIRKLVNHDRKVDSEALDIKQGVQEHNLEHAANALMVQDMENEHHYEKDAVDMDDSKYRSRDFEGQDVAGLRQELAKALDELEVLKADKYVYSQEKQSLETELETLDEKKKELQELLNQEEQKSASLREKLNLAVRKGKSVVQQRDGLKQNIEEMTAEIDRLKSMIKSHELAQMESGQSISDLYTQLEMYKTFEAENLSLKNRLIEVEQHLQQNSHTLSLLLDKLGQINADEGIYSHDPLQKLEGIIKMCSDLQLSASSFEQEAKKSKKSAELLLAELNEVQERNDGLQEELERTYDEISNLSKDRDLANSAKLEALSRLDKVIEERENQLAELEGLKSTVLGVKKVFLDISASSDDMFAKDLEILHNMKAHMEPHLELDTDPAPAKDHSGLVSVNSKFKDFFSRTSAWGNKVSDPLEETAGFDICKVIDQHLQQLTETISNYKEKIHGHSMSFRAEAEWLSTAIGCILREVDSQRSSLESVKCENIRLESIMKEKDVERAVLHRGISLLYDAFTSSIIEIGNRKAQLAGETFAAEDLRNNLPSLPTTDGINFSSAEESVKALADMLLVAVKDFAEIGTKGVEGHSKELKATLMGLQKELQEKDIQRERICMELVSQIKEAEATAANSSRDLQSMTNYAHDLENKLKALGEDNSLLEQRVDELQQKFHSLTDLGEQVKSLTDVVASKDQEIEALMQALEEEENQMEAMRSKIDELENTVQQKNTDFEHLEASRAKAHKKLAVTVGKFDELHHMSQGLLSEVENLQTQLQDRDAEISFLRQEVTRCTNDVLEATKMAKERSSGELREILTWLDTVISGILHRDVRDVDVTDSHHPEYKEQVQQDLMSIVSELEDLRIAAQSKDTLLQIERNKTDELSQRKDVLEALLHEKEQQLNALQGVGVSRLGGTSEIVEVEPVLNKWTAPVPSSQVRSLRKVNNDQVSIAIDADAGSSGRIEDEDDDKVHGFKSLTTSRFVPKFTRPVSDMIDGLWVSCDRALMRQPALRLGIMIYWAVLHAFLASFIV